MKKNAFTLIELLISIFLLGLIVNFVYTAIANLQKTNTIFMQKSQSVLDKQKLMDLLYGDIFSAKSVKITTLETSVVDLVTPNSLYDIEYPHVTWLVSKEKETLMRFESTLPFDAFSSENAHLYHVSKISEDCKKFMVYQSNDKNNILLHVQFEDEEPLVYEFFKPMQSSKDANTTNNSNNGTSDVNETNRTGIMGTLP